MTHIRLAVLASLAALALATGALAQGTPRLVGTTGPGFTITLVKGGQKVKTLSPGAYSLTIRDRSGLHNFRLKGPGLNRATSVEKRGTTTWTVKLRRGTYRFICDPHQTAMKGSFTVG